MFNEKLKIKPHFSISKKNNDEHVICIKCLSIFTIDYGDYCNITDHMKTSKHKLPEELQKLIVKIIEPEDKAAE